MPDQGFAYLDNAATTPLREEALEAMLPYLRERFANPSAGHRAAREVRRAVDEAREELAGLFGCSESEVVLTSGGTESDNLAITGVMGGHRAGLVVSAIEHRAVLEPAGAAGALIVGARPDGTVDLDELRTCLEGAVLVSVMTVNSETGVIQPVAEVVRLVHERAPDALVHTDAVQAYPWCEVSVLTADCDLVSYSAHKFGGPKGAGALVVRQRARSRLAPLLRGGPQEGELRAGTENVAGIVGMATAARLCAEERSASCTRVARLRNRLADGLVAMVPGTRESAPRANRVAGNCHLLFAGVDSEELLMLLDGANVAASAGSACASGAIEPSHVLLAMGIPLKDARSAIRFSLGATTTDAEVDHALAATASAVSRLRTAA